MRELLQALLDAEGLDAMVAAPPRPRPDHVAGAGAQLRRRRTHPHRAQRREHPGPRPRRRVHHPIHWIDGGETRLENSALFCERHHTQVHHGFRVERPPDGRWRAYRPDGTEILLAGSLLATR